MKHPDRSCGCDVGRKLSDITDMCNASGWIMCRAKMNSSCGTVCHCTAHQRSDRTGDEVTDCWAIWSRDATYGKNPVSPLDEPDILGENQLRGKTGNIDSFMDFHIASWCDCSYIALVLCTQNLASPVNRVLESYQSVLISCPTVDLRYQFSGVTLMFWGHKWNIQLDVLMWWSLLLWPPFYYWFRINSKSQLLAWKYLPSPPLHSNRRTKCSCET
jgi:hypothetical protein